MQLKSVVRYWGRDLYDFQTLIKGNCGPGSSVGIATDYGLDGPGIESEPDTVQHRMTECGEGTRIWNWTKRCIAWILITHPANIPQDWTTKPQFQLWPPQVTVRCYGYWTKFCGTEPKRIEQGTSKTTVTS